LLARAPFPSFRMPNKPARLWPDALVLTALFFLMAMLPAISSLLEYRRDAILSGEVWRVFSGHFVHLNLAHALLNAVGTTLVALLFPREMSRQQWWGLVLVAPLVISLGLWFKQPGLQGYAGFSGVLHSLLYLGVVRMLPGAPALAGSVLLLLIGRQIWEQTGAYDPAYLQGVIAGRVMPDAHLFGGLTGLLLGGLTLWHDYRAGRLGKPKSSGYSSGTGPTPDA